MQSNDFSPEMVTFPGALPETGGIAARLPHAGDRFRFWRCLACGINWRIDYGTELCESCFARIFPSER